MASFSMPSSSSSLLRTFARGAAKGCLRAAIRAFTASGAEPKRVLWKPSSNCSSRAVLTCPHLPRKRRHPGAIHVATFAEEKDTRE